MIGIFDSGSGGLSVLKALRQVIPLADIVYFGDIKNAPYGLKSQEELSTLTVRAVDLLRREGADHIVSACNSVAASLVISLSDRITSAPSDMIEMVGPTVAHFRDTNNTLALCATVATINSGIYQNAFELIGKEVQTIAIPDLAGVIESGAGEETIKHMIATAFADVHDFETLILACTHYPLVLSTFREVLPSADIFDPSRVVAERTLEAFPSEVDGSGLMRFIISADSLPFRALVNTFFGESEYTIDIQES